MMIYVNFMAMYAKIDTCLLSSLFTIYIYPVKGVIYELFLEIKI